jgi:hypothetical protein
MLTTASLLLRWQHATTEVLPFPQPAEHVVHHRCCRQPQWPQSGNGHSSLPSQHKADCCVEQGQIVGDLLIGSSSLSLRHSCPAAVSCLPLSLLCRLPQPVPPPFVALLRPTCSVDCCVARWPPSTSQPAPPPLFTPPHLLVVALHCITLSGALASPPPLSSCLCLSLCPSCLVGSCVVLPGAPASLSAQRIGLSSHSRLLSRRRAPLLMHPFYSTPPPFDVPFGIVKQFKLARQWGDSTKTHVIWIYYCARMAVATKKTTIGNRHCTYN